MQSLQARIDSFHKTRRVKRYPNKPSSSAASVKWPHPPDFKANPNTLAEAGFFFNPSWGDRDSVACFLCGKELSDWNADDDPFEIHYIKCQSSCAWAVVRCGLTEDLDNRGRFSFKNRTRLPSTKAMEKARLATFGEDWWPHDSDVCHGATSVKMAQAGFVYTPQAAGDDTVTCLYCNLSLGGWEAKDSPSQEHRKRDSKSGTACPFLAFSEQQSEDELAAVHVTGPQPSRSRRGKARSATSTATSRTRRKTRATRGKPVKAAASVSQRSPSPGRAIPHEPDPAPIPDASLNALITGNPMPHPDVRSPALSNESHLNSTIIHESSPMRPLGDEPGSRASSKPCASPTTTFKHPDPIVSLSPVGQPIVASSQPLTDHERAMSLEQWIRREISLGYEKLLTDGQRQIGLFRAKAIELRKCIDGL